MKKVILILLFFTSAMYSQSTKISAFITKDEIVSFDQYDLIKKINDYYPDLLVSKSVKNCFSNNLKENVLIESYLNYELTSQFLSYSILLYPDNTRIDYSYETINSGFVYGNVTLFNGDVIRTMYVVKSDSTYYGYYVNSKLIYKS